MHAIRKTLIVAALAAMALATATPAATGAALAASARTE